MNGSDNQLELIQRISTLKCVFHRKSCTVTINEDGYKFTEICCEDFQKILESKFDALATGLAKKNAIKLLSDRLGKQMVNNLNQFFSVYELEKQLFFNIKKSLGSGRSKEERFCRFCKKGVPETTFNTTPHVIPEFLGRARLISDYECDSCNSYFGQIEESFAKYLGPLRSIYAIKKKSGTPKHKTSGGAIIQAHTQDTFEEFRKSHPKVQDVSQYFDGENLIMPFLKQGDDDSIIIHENSIEINALKQPYIPFHIFKTFLKMSFSLLDEVEVDKYEGIRKALFSEPVDPIKDPNVAIYHYNIDITPPIFRSPVIEIYSPIQPGPEKVSKILILCIADTIFICHILSDRNVKYLVEGNDIEAQIPPCWVNPMLEYLPKLNALRQEDILNSFPRKSARKIDLRRIDKISDDCFSGKITWEGPSTQIN